MVILPRHVTPAAAARRAWLADLLAALAITTVALLLATGIGVVAFFALLTLIVLLSWLAIESLLARLRRRSAPRRPRRSLPWLDDG